MKNTLIRSNPNLIQINRQKHLHRFCENVSMVNRHADYGHLLLSDIHKAIYCFVPKVACTNWKKIFYKLEHPEKKSIDFGGKQGVHYLRFKAVQNGVSLNNEKRKYFKFLIVRDPFEKLLSAFRNKFLDPYEDDLWFQEKYGQIILRKYRNNLTEEEYSKGENVTFPEFAQYLIDLHKKVGESTFNPHWRSIHKLCFPCFIKFDFIGKFETLVQDSNQILNIINATEITTFEEDGRDKYKEKSAAIMNQYFNLLTKKQVKGLYEIYRYDFEAFGYEIPDFLKQKLM